MNGPHDVGGMHGFGPVAPEPERDEPIFHAPWEARALALTLCAGALGHWNIDRSRHTRESLPPAVYFGSSYYEIWTRGLERLLREEGLVDDDELREGRSLRSPAPTRRPPLLGADVPGLLSTGSPYDRPASGPSRFAVGDRVRAVNVHVAGHTRLPRYVRGHIGTVEAVRGAFVFPDANAHGTGPDPQWCYTVVFDAAELWGSSADPRSTVAVDAFEPYLEAA